MSFPTGKAGGVNNGLPQSIDHGGESPTVKSGCRKLRKTTSKDKVHSVKSGKVNKRSVDAGKALSTRLVSKKFSRNNLVRRSRFQPASASQKQAAKYASRGAGLGAVVGGLIGAALGTVVGVFIGPAGPIIGGIIGAYLGGMAGAHDGDKMPLSDKEVAHIAPGSVPHREPMMKRLLGNEAVELLTKRYPTAADLRKIDEAIRSMPKVMDEIRNSDDYKSSPERKDYFEKKFLEYTRIANEYADMAKDRAFPKAKKIMGAWQKTAEAGDIKNANKDLEKVVDFFVAKADENSGLALAYFRDEMVKTLDRNGQHQFGESLALKMNNKIAELDGNHSVPHQQSIPNKSVEVDKVSVSTNKRDPQG